MSDKLEESRIQRKKIKYTKGNKKRINSYKRQIREKQSPHKRIKCRKEHVIRINTYE